MLSNTTNLSSLNPFSCKIQIFKVTLKVSYVLRNFENLQRFFTGEPWPWCPQWVFGGKLSFPSNPLFEPHLSSTFQPPFRSNKQASAIFELELVSFHLE